MAQKDPEMSRALRTPPHNIDAEKALLGAILIKPELMHDVSVNVYLKVFMLTNIASSIKQS
jgi:replicative DNA helicase